MLRSLFLGALLAALASAALAADAETVRGKVKAFHENPKGDRDGLILTSGTEVRFPPHLGEKVTGAVAVGDEVRVVGESHKGPKGDTHFRATLIANDKSGAEVKIDGPPKKPRDERPPHEQILVEVRALRALLEDGKPNPEPKPATAEADRKIPHHEQIIAELREVQELVKKRLPTSSK